MKGVQSSINEATKNDRYRSTTQGLSRDPILTQTGGSQLPKGTHIFSTTLLSLRTNLAFLDNFLFPAAT
jgi:hypothetical protein